MKKSITLLLMATIAGICSLRAQDITARAIISVSIPTGMSDQVSLVESTSFSKDFDDSWDSQKTVDPTSTSMSLYVLMGDMPMSTLATNDLSGTQLVFRSTSNETQYTFSFSRVSGTQLYLNDSENKIQIPVAEGESYAFSCQANTTFANRFSISKTKDTLSQTEQLWPISMDDITYGTYSNRVVSDLRADFENVSLLIWSAGETYVGGNAAGLNFFDNTEGYVSLVVTDQGWSGFGYEVGSEESQQAVQQLKEAIIANPEDYYLHIAIKSKSEPYHQFYIFGDNAISFILGSNEVVDGYDGEKGAAIPMGDFERDGKWHDFYISMKPFAQLLASSQGNSNTLLAAMSGGVQGTELDLDAIYFCNETMRRILVAPTDTVTPEPNDTIHEPTVTIFGIDVPVDPSGSGEKVDILGDSTLVYDPTNNTLTIDSLTLTVGEEEGTAISYSGEEPLTIVLNYESSIIADTVIASTADIIITGTGSLVAEGTVPIFGEESANITFDSVNMYVHSLPSAAAVRKRIRGIKMVKEVDETGGPALSGFGSADFNKVNVSPSDALYGPVSTGAETINALYVTNGSGIKEIVTEFTLTAIPDIINAVETGRASRRLGPQQPMYNILGVPVDASYKGIVLQNGQKYLIQ